MKRMMQWVLAATRPLVLTMGPLVLTMVFCGLGVFTSCSIDDNPAEPGREEKIPAHDFESLYVTSQKPTFVGDITTMPADLQTAVRERFPNQVGSIEEAQVVIIGSANPNIVAAPDKVVAIMSANGGNVLTATHGDGDQYTMMDEEEPLVAKDNIYWNMRISAFVEWVETYEAPIANPYNGDQPSFEEMKLNMGLAGVQNIYVNIPFSYGTIIDEATLSEPDILTGYGSLTFQAKILPVYSQSVNGANSGDYYLVKSTVVPHNDGMWNPFIGAHGWTRNRVYGFWFKEMTYRISLLNPDGSDINGLTYNMMPLPENKIGKVEHTETTSYSLSASAKISLGAEGTSEERKGKVGFEAGATFGASWTESTKYSFDNISYNRDSSTPVVTYTWKSNNVKLTDDWDKMDVNFPVDVHSEFACNNSWVWFVPRGTNGIDDSTKKEFKLNITANLTYSSWYHWRWAVEYDSNRKNYKIKPLGYTVNVNAPDRTPWGVISLTNAAKNYTVRNVKVFKKGETTEEPEYFAQGSYEYNEKAIMATNEGTYILTFEYVDPNNWNKVMARGTIYNIKVKQGKTQGSATTVVSTAEAEVTLVAVYES
ncbi:MAG: hypothetical protein II450_06985 [Prevotella sp.]|nr:hypothetical protein [Prevotella sp.]